MQAVLALIVVAKPFCVWIWHSKVLTELLTYSVLSHLSNVVVFHWNCWHVHVIFHWQDLLHLIFHQSHKFSEPLHQTIFKCSCKRTGMNFFWHLCFADEIYAFAMVFKIIWPLCQFSKLIKICINIWLRYLVVTCAGR